MAESPHPRLNRNDSAQAGSLLDRKRKNEANRSLGTCPKIEGDEAARKREIYGQTFKKFDKDNSGSIDVGELRALLEELKWPADEKAVANARKALDADGNGEIELEEFLSWTKYAWNTQIMSSGRDGCDAVTPSAAASLAGSASSASAANSFAFKPTKLTTFNSE